MEFEYYSILRLVEYLTIIHDKIIDLVKDNEFAEWDDENKKLLISIVEEGLQSFDF